MKKINSNDVIERYKDYSKREFGVEENVSVFIGLGLMYTTVNDDEYDVQVSYDIPSRSLTTTISDGDKTYSFSERLSLEDFYEELETATFDMYYSYAHQVCEERFSLDLEW